MEPKLSAKAADKPLAVRLRPRRWDDYVGQCHLLEGEESLRSRQLHSFLLWGPPGCGKTTLARLYAEGCGAQIAFISPVQDGVKELKACLQQARLLRDEQQQATVVLVDEIHRFNKAQQDYFLPHVEEGLFTLIGTTTENPSFELNSALLSRLTVYQLSVLKEHELNVLVQRCCALTGIEIADQAASLLLAHADGDARRLLNQLEQLLEAGKSSVGERDVEQLMLRQLRRFDKRGDEFYDQISALIKSVRGSDPNAALYWMCRMLDGGADPKYLARRLIRLATEDIGMADPDALAVAVNADAQYQRLGSPEGELGLAQALIYLACAPKSNSVYAAFAGMQELVRKHGSQPVPLHLRNAPTKLLKQLSHGRGYRYVHDEPHGYAAGESYWPEGLRPAEPYKPSARGFERTVAKRLQALRKLDQQSTDYGGDERADS